MTTNNFFFFNKSLLRLLTDFRNGGIETNLKPFNSVTKEGAHLPTSLVGQDQHAWQGVPFLLHPID